VPAIAGPRKGLGGIAFSREFLLLAALAILCLGVTIRLGTYSPSALELVVLAALLTATALRTSGELTVGVVPWAIVVGGTASIVLFYANPLGLPVASWFAPVLVLAIIGIVLGHFRVIRGIAAVIAVVALTGCVVSALRSTAPAIDVYQSLQGASAALLHGTNPYQPVFSAESPVTPFTFMNVPVHFEYLPGAAILTAPGRLLGDVRFMSVIAFIGLIASAVRLAWQSPERGTRALRVGALCLALPMTVAIVYFSWVDVFSMAGFAGWLALRNGHRRWAILFLVVTLTVKPVILIAMVPALLWSRRARQEFGVAVVIAAAVILPFVLMTGAWNFYQDVAGLQAALGFRGDGLTLNAAWYSITGHLLPVWFAVVAGTAVAWFALRRRPRDLADVLTSGALLSTCGFLLAKWAFLNYYFIPVWLLVLALACRGMALEDSAADVSLPGYRLLRDAYAAIRHPHPIPAGSAL
jgi:hypothetical protein